MSEDEMVRAYLTERDDVQIGAELAEAVWHGLCDALEALEIIAMDGQASQRSERAMAGLIARGIRQRMPERRPPEWVLPDIRLPNP